MRLAGERALVTGSTSGIGRAVAVRFAAEGAAVAVTGRDRDRGAAVVDEISTAGGQAVFVPAELEHEHECATLVANASAELGGLSVLVNNAAAAMPGAGVVEVATNDWERALRVNLTAPMWLCRAAIPEMMRAGHGAIVNVSTRQAERASAGLAAYIASKAGLNGLTRSIAVDYARHGIRCNTISPGYVVNEQRDRDLDAEPARRERYEGMHLTRLGVADDVALAAVYLASRESEFVTGINLQVDGGSSIARGLTLG